MTYFFSLTSLFLALDLFNKWAALHYLTSPIVLIPSVLQLRLAHNTGIAFSIPIPNNVMLVVAPLGIGLLVWLLLSTTNFKLTLTKVIISLMVAGALGNFIDRLTKGAVTDFIDFSFWPTFNLADSYLTIGAFLIILFYGRISRNRRP